MWRSRRSARLTWVAAFVVTVAGCADGSDDFDGDGTVDTVDCAPEDPAVHPGADEICNGIDDDCDGGIDDEGCSDDDTADDDSADDDTSAGDDDAPPHPTGFRFCAGAHHATGGGFTVDACTGPVELAPGIATNGDWTVVVDVLRTSGGNSR